MRKQSHPNHSYEFLSSIYRYDTETGILYNRKLNKPTGTTHPTGYLRVRLRIGESGARRHYMVHRLAWFLVHGTWPADQIDHVNGIRGDNRLCNLREATAQQNLQSRPMHKRNQLGVKGVTQVKGRFRAQLWNNGRFVLSKTFGTIEEASAAYQAKAREVFGEWHRS